MDIVGLYVPTRQIKAFTSFNVSNALRLDPTTRCAIAANSIRQFLDVFSKDQHIPAADMFHIIHNIIYELANNSTLLQY
jgi:hypothetical protein